MIFGDPYKFAIQIDYVREWNIDDEGVFTFIVAGYYHPLELFAVSESIYTHLSTLCSTVHDIFYKKDNLDLFFMDCKEAYKKLNHIGKEINKKFNDPAYSDYIDELEKLRDSCFLGMLSFNWPNNDYAWILYGDNEEKIIFKKPNGEISEIILDKGYCLRVMLDVLYWAKGHYKNTDAFQDIGTKYRYDLIPQG